ncbi:MAG TPA: hypothetical protein PKN57_02775 [Saprospiraceae bacterium]|nr:hypothetical protein [Saprospiraceae bacterium]HNL28790.1 hypothetical protein [Saprospiraceae bacterium]HNM57145.1 hypothetical protein [Saprospiraceae bacterium]HNO36824.1 hypothetical protein [Saprospiraceae bacterium]
MKNKSFKRFLTLATVAVFFLTFTSCNRGTGCPNNFSLKSLAKVVSNF